MTEFDRGRKEGLREAGIIADRIADELEFSRCQQVATRIRSDIVRALAGPTQTAVCATCGGSGDERIFRIETGEPCPTCSPAKPESGGR